MSDPTIKIKVTADVNQARGAIRMTAKQLDDLAAKAAKASAANAVGASATAAKFTEMATGIQRVSAVFRNALGLFGVIGAISTAINIATRLWNAFSAHAQRAAKRTEEASRKLAEAREKVEDLNQARLDMARKNMRAFADEVARARDNANALSAAVADVAAAQASYDASRIDLAVARGEMPKEEAEAAKARIATEAAMDSVAAKKSQAFENLQAAEALVGEFRSRYPGLVVGEDGKVEPPSSAYSKFGTNDVFAKRYAGTKVGEKYAHEAKLAGQELAHLVSASKEYENAIKSLSVAQKQYEAAMLQADASVNKAATDEVRIREAAGKAAADALEKSERDLAKSQIDLDIQRGTKSRKAGELEKQKLDLEAERKAAAEAVESRRAFLEKDGQAPEADATLTALTNNLETIQNKMDLLNEAMANVADEDDRRKGPGSALAITSDRWGRIGAFAGGGSQAESLNIQKGSYDALKAIRIMCDRIHRSMRYPSIPVL